MIKALLVTLLVGISLLSCKNNREGHQDHPEKSPGQEDSVYYTCPMHPSVISDNPGSCPICGMDLIKKTVSKKNDLQDHGQMLHLDTHQQWLANIKTDTIRIKNISSFYTVTGTVIPDENRIQSVAARIKGRIEKLYIKNPGTKIQRGQEIMRIYSEQLLAEENDFLNILKQKEQVNEKRMINEMLKSAKQKLALWGLTEEQIARLEKDRYLSPYISFFSDVSGYLTRIEIREGQYIEEGTLLFDVADLKTVWVEAQFYADETIHLDNTIEITIDAFPQEVFTGQIVYSNPIISENSKINPVRISLENPLEKIKPGMMAYIRYKYNDKETLVAPKSALLQENMKTLWVQTEPGMFERRMVQTGIENHDEVEIIKGVSEGEVIVSSGAYLLNSEFILKKGGTAKHQH